jgi:PPM family protein phosphatase
MALECEARSEVAGRRNNEDRVFASARLVAVADGVGGAAAGEVASRIIIDALGGLEACFLNMPLMQALEEAVGGGNERIRFVTSCRPQWAGMATTLSSVALDDDGQYVVANIGDSRTYLFRDGELALLTRDDTYVQLMVDRGELTVEEARRHPQRSLVLNVLDGDLERRPRLRVIEAEVGDRLLLCSDGLTDVVDDETLVRLLSHNDRHECADLLVDEALMRGGTDNISVIVADCWPMHDDCSPWRRAGWPGEPPVEPDKHS